MDLSNAKIAANLSVTDMDRAVEFYQKTLGLKVTKYTDWLAVVLSSDGSMIALAQRQHTQSDEDTANFTVSDIKAVITELKNRGVKFQDYELPNLKTVDHIASAEGFQAAWFKDSEGNTLQINQSPS